MLSNLKESIWNQFGASIETLENAIMLCPEQLWENEKYWYSIFHCLFFLDYYLSTDPVNFVPPAPFTQSEFEDKMPERIYTKDELITYLHFCKTKCRTLINSLSTETINNRWVNESKTMDYSIIEIMLYNMRHVQHHAAQINMLLRQDINAAPKWVRRETGKL